MPDASHFTTREHIPIFKVGGVVVRKAPELPEGFCILIIRPKPKHASEATKFVLPRGSRQFETRDADGVRRMQDARDDETAKKYAHALELTRETLERELSEEAGLTPDALARALVTDLGAMQFHSTTKAPYNVHWYLVKPDPRDAGALDARIEANDLPADTVEMRWASLREIKTLADGGDFSPGYVAVIEAALRRERSDQASYEKLRKGRIF